MASNWDTAINVILGVCVVVLLKKLFTPTPAPQPLKKRKGFFLMLLLKVIVLPEREFTLEELRFFDGTHEVPELDNEKPIYLALNGTVFDVSSRASFYGPG
jgi:hypothetical protein